MNRRLATGYGVAKPSGIKSLRASEAGCWSVTVVLKSHLGAPSRDEISVETEAHRE